MIAAYYLDTSAVVKRYVDEPGSAWVRSLTDPAQHLLLVASKLALAEMTSALMRRQREGTLDPATYTALLQAFRTDCQAQYELVDVTDTVVTDACQLLERHPLRTLDALHLASALIALRFLLSHHDTGLIFVSADDRLLTTASAEGLTVENPNAHS